MKPGEDIRKRKIENQEPLLEDLIYEKLGLGWQNILVDRVITKLSNKLGFTDWWDEIEEDTKSEIEFDLYQVICDFFEK